MSDTNNANGLSSLVILKPTAKTATFTMPSTSTGIQVSDAIGKGFITINVAGAGSTSVISYQAQYSSTTNGTYTNIGDAVAVSAAGASELLSIPIDFSKIAGADGGANAFFRVVGTFASGSDSTIVSSVIHYFKRLV